MLSLTVKVGKRVCIYYGDARAEIEIVEANNRRVRMRFEAPDDVKILRDDLVPEEGVNGGGYAQR